MLKLGQLVLSKRLELLVIYGKLSQAVILFCFLFLMLHRSVNFIPGFCTTEYIFQAFLMHFILYFTLFSTFSLMSKNYHELPILFQPLSLSLFFMSGFYFSTKHIIKNIYGRVYTSTCSSGVMMSKICVPIVFQ